jgi:hypothetical protein
VTRAGLFALSIALLAHAPAAAGEDAPLEWKFLEADSEAASGVIQVVAEVEIDDALPADSEPPLAEDLSAPMSIVPDAPQYMDPAADIGVGDWPTEPTIIPEPAAAPRHGTGCWDRPWLSGFRTLLRPPLPVIGERWTERSLNAGLFVGGFQGDELIKGQVCMGAGAIGGVRLGWDFDAYWGIEGRIGMASADVSNQVGPPQTRSGQVTMFDSSVLFYPYTTTRWRPFLLAGIGLAIFDYDNLNGLNIVDSTPTFPIGVGVKYRHDDWVAFRLDFTDTIALGDGTKRVTTNNLSLTGGVEFRFGGPRRTYWPWSQEWLR